MENNMTTVARINGVSIQIIEAGEKMVPVKPICEALGITMQGQLEVLKTHPIYSSVIKMILTTGSDGKQYEMITIPLEFVFGWLCNIDSRKVKEESKEPLLRYQLECHHALYNYFTRLEDFLEFRQSIIDEKLLIYDNARIDFRDAKDKVLTAREELNRARKINQQDYFDNKNQLMLDFGFFGKEAADAAG
jgi:hypothetical protein